MSLDSRELRNALGQFATGICVITANPEGQEPFGMTVNSFAAVSLEPPLVLWSIQKDSECMGSFENAKQYTVNILEKGQEALSNQYAKKGDHGLVKGQYRQGRSGCVVLKDALASFECDIEARIDGGDHVILLGRVVDMTRKPDGEPLVFFGGKYRELK
jgi:flavin reductase (DIM6/NTAB) family NADH-FMN oxidoreductase RutF